MVLSHPAVHRVVGLTSFLAIAGAGPAAAATCDGGAIGARFSEAAKVCVMPVSQGGAPVVAAAVVVPDRAASVSVRMPGYRKRIEAAVQQVNRAGPVPTAPLVRAVAHRYRIDPQLLASIVHAESAGRAGAISNKGALGLMQVMPATARGLGVADPRAMLRDPVLAMSAGAAYLKQLQRQFGNNVPLVLAAYNAGPGAVVRYRGIPRYRETQGYVGTIMSRYVAARSNAVAAR